MKNRAIYLDTVCGLLLVYMICGHCAQTANVYSQFEKYTYWLGFFMPWFFFKGGLFYRQRATKEVIMIGFNRLIVPFIWFSIIGTSIMWIGQIIRGEFTLFTLKKYILGFLAYGSFYGNLALWFLLSLFVVRIVFSFIHNKYSSSSTLMAKCLIGGGLGALCIFFIPYHYLINHYNLKYYPLYLSNISSGLLFYTCGYLLRNCKLKKIEASILFLIYIVMVVFVPVIVDMRSGKTDSRFYLLYIPYCLIGIEAFNNITRLFYNKRNILSQIGKDTMPFYCMHMCVIELVRMCCPVTILPNEIFFIILIFANVILLPVCTFLIRRTRFKFILG